MFNESFQARIKGIKFRVEGSQKLADLTLEMELGGDLAGSLPRGVDVHKALSDGEFKRLVMETAAVEFELSMKCPVRDANPKSKPDLYAEKGVKVLEVALARKESHEGGAATVIARPLLSLRLTDELALYVARHFADSDLTFRLTNLQPSLPLGGNGGNGKSEAKPAEPERQLELDQKSAPAAKGNGAAKAKKPGKSNGKRARG